MKYEDSVPEDRGKEEVHPTSKSSSRIKILEQHFGDSEVAMTGK